MRLLGGTPYMIYQPPKPCTLQGIRWEAREEEAYIYKESPRGAASGMSRCHFFWWLQTSLLSLFLVQLGWNFNMLVSDLGGVNWLWPFMVLSQIYGRSNFSHNFCQLTLLARFMAKIWDAINLAQYHKWPKSVYYPKVWHQHIKISAN